MKLEEDIRSHIKNAFKSIFEIELDSAQLFLQPTRKEFEGTHTFVVFPFLKASKKSPEATAIVIGDYLKSRSGMIKDYNVVKGFLNLEIGTLVWISCLDDMLKNQHWGQLAANGKKVMVEFSSPNTNKPLHLGHLRNNFLGDAMSRIIEAAGYQVKRTNLVNDRGIHICKSMLAYQRWGKGETPETAQLKGDHLAGKYYVLFDKYYKEEIATLVGQGVSEEEAKKKAPILVEAQEMLQKWEQKDAEVMTLWNNMNAWVYAGFETTYQTMGIEFDAIYKESETYLLGKDIIEEGLKKQVFYQREDGSVWIDLKEEGLDEKLVMRSDGTSVYITQDIGTCDFKYEDFPMDQSVYVVGNEQDYHFNVLFAIMKKMGRPYGEGLYHLSYGMVDLPSGKMKSREGTVVDADELMDEMFTTAAKHTLELGKIEGLTENESKNLFRMVGLGALKFFLLKVDPKKRMLFDPKESIEFQGHTGPFVQYTHARISAILRRASTDGINEALSPIQNMHPREQILLAHLVRFEEVIVQAARDYSPALLAQYVYDLAKDYNGFYQELSIFNEPDDPLVTFRISLSRLTAKVIRRSMNLLGIEVPNRM
ncbi:arginine--tRNA ligase [Cyclobacteriaceae bacterium]|nr:arginine--tRNA ligase [Cyclobacteriaceae bacterium]MDB4012531.1 arginine--tRNA ligase [Cyclobacteriaceae bacterium]